jgi:hypothetical protein
MQRPSCRDQFERRPDRHLEPDWGTVIMPIRALEIMRCVKLATFIAVWIALAWSIWGLQS